MQLLSRFTKELKYAATQLRWKWRLASLGWRTTVGKCRRIVSAPSISIGAHVTLCDGWFLADLKPDEGKRPKIRIDDWCTILDEFQCNAAVGVEIQHHVLMAGRVFISDSDHIVDPDGEHTSRCASLISKPVVIEHDCWLGQNAVILKGVRVGHHSIVAANAVVTKNVEPCSVVAGVPARVIGTTRKNSQAMGDAV